MYRRDRLLPGLPLVTQVDDEERRSRTLDDVVDLVAPSSRNREPERVEIAGVQARRV